MDKSPINADLIKIIFDMLLTKYDLQKYIIYEESKTCFNLNATFAWNKDQRDKREILNRFLIKSNSLNLDALKGKKLTDIFIGDIVHITYEITPHSEFFYYDNDQKLMNKYNFSDIYLNIESTISDLTRKYYNQNWQPE